MEWARCISIRPNAKYCIAVCSQVWCAGGAGLVQYSALWVLHSEMGCSAVWCSAVWCSAVWCRGQHHLPPSDAFLGFIHGS